MIEKYLVNVDKEKFINILEYNVGNGKQMRFQLLEHLLTVLNPTFDRNLLVQGYAIELIQAGFLIIDDIMDNSEYRRGNKCHYKVRGLLAYRDGRFLVSLGTRIIQEVDPFLGTDAVYFTCVGQSLDTIDKTIEDYKFSLYQKICETKTSIYSFYLPLDLAYKSLDLKQPENLKEFCILAGYIFQVYDDYINFVPEESKKTGNDLEEGKLTYFTALLGESKQKYDFIDYFSKRKIDQSLMNFIEKVKEICKMEICKSLEDLNTMVIEQNKELEFIIKMLKSHTFYES
jgi:farnesyl diphosphate synthase